MIPATAAALALAGCGDEIAGTASGDGLSGRAFWSEQVTEDGSDRELVEGTRVSLEFTDDGRLVASAGCNILSTDVTVGEGTLEVTGVGGTEMGCDPELQAQDEWLAAFLSTPPTWALDGDRLTLTAGTTEIVLLDREVADPDRPLEATRWVVDTVVTGETASSMHAGTEGSAWLEIDGESFTAHTGCREVSGSVAVEDGTLRFSDAVQTDPACLPELEELDEVMLAVLTAEVEYAIQAARLRLTHPDDVGLELHADE